MERDPNDTYTSQTGASQGGTTPGSGAGSSGGMSPGSYNTPGTYGTTDGTAGATGADSFGGTGTASAGTGAPETADVGVGGQSRTEQAQEKLGQAREKVGQAGERARELKHNVESTLADKLHAGANKLRERAPATAGDGTAAFAGATGAGSGTVASELQPNELPARLAGGMDATADWLRNGDLKVSIEEQARTNPGRTLLVALGVGYLLGKALRR